MNITLTSSEATRLEGAQRLTFLPVLFSSDFMSSEATVYAYASRHIHGYEGGLWHYFRLSDGAGYMVPDMETVTFSNPGNYFEKEVSAEVAGIIITALVLNHRSWHHSHHDRDELCRHFCQRYEQLMAFAAGHPEAATIYRALD